MPIRIRDVMTAPLTIDYVNQRTAEGWTAAAVEWVKASPSDKPNHRGTDLAEVPYGQRVSGDCAHLSDDPLEMDVLMLIYEKVVAGWRPPHIAAELNSRGHRTRSGGLWTPAAVFDLMPRLIELSPKIHDRPDWPSRRAAIEVVA